MRRALAGHWVRVLVGLLVGAAVGVVVYQASQLTGRGLFVVAGATAGAVAAVVVGAYTSGAARLTDITVTVPQLSELHFVLTPATQQAAWRLFNQMSTRVATRPLAPGTGKLREALTSLYSLFLTSREITDSLQVPKDIDREPTVHLLANRMLNRELAPFLSLWHPELLDWESVEPERPESEWPRNSQCRADLAAMQLRLGEYLRGFGRLAGLTDRQIDLLLAEEDPSQPEAGSGNLSQPGGGLA